MIPAPLTCASEEGYYLTVTGTSAEMGDDGSVGRGNRANGLITPNRPMSMEATSGKNPLNHVGKIYNLLSNRMAEDIVKEVEGVQQVHIMILSQIGKPIDHPKAASAQIILKDGYSMGGRTGRDGIHGVTFASEELTTKSEIEDRPAVQVGDPFTKKQVMMSRAFAGSCFIIGSITFSRAVNWGRRLKRWKTKPISLLRNIACSF